MGVEEVSIARFAFLLCFSPYLPPTWVPSSAVAGRSKTPARTATSRTDLPRIIDESSVASTGPTGSRDAHRARLPRLNRQPVRAGHRLRSVDRPRGGLRWPACNPGIVKALVTPSWRIFVRVRRRRAGRNLPPRGRGDPGRPITVPFLDADLQIPLIRAPRVTFRSPKARSNFDDRQPRGFFRSSDRSRISAQGWEARASGPLPPRPTRCCDPGRGFRDLSPRALHPRRLCLPPGVTDRRRASRLDATSPSCPVGLIGTDDVQSRLPSRLPELFRRVRRVNCRGEPDRSLLVTRVRAHDHMAPA